jgi:hypothetical protein
MLKPAATITEFVMAKLTGEPVGKRASIYRALAELSPSKADRQVLRSLALECDAIDAAHEQLSFDFQQRARKTANPFTGEAPHA